MSLTQTNTLDEPMADAGGTSLNLICKGRQNGPAIQWTLTRPDGANAGSVDCPRGTGPWNVRIGLVPPEGVNLTYRTNDPIWAGENGCPPAPGINTPQISNVSLLDPMTLTFVDNNTGAACDVTYQLNFSDGTAFDPVFRNGGGR